MPQLGAPHQNIAIRFGVEKPEWCGFSTVRRVWGYDYLYWQNTRMWQKDGQTDRWTPH